MEISDRYAIDPKISGSPTAYDLCYYAVSGESECIGTCIVFDQEEPVFGFGARQDYLEQKGLATINSLSIKEDYRGMGFGLYLLRSVMSHLYYQKNIRYAELDDVTDYFGRSDCIYCKAGFVYDQDDNHMLANLRQCVQNV